MFIYLYQLHIIAIFSNLRKFFDKNTSNLISFWDCPSNDKWSLYLLVNKKSKFHKISLILPSKISWELSKKEEYNLVIRKWQMYFQAFDYKRRYFLDLNNNNNQSICPTYSKSSA